MLKAIKVKNTKKNIVTVLVILLFLAYFTVSYTVNRSYTVDMLKSLEY